MDSGKTDVLVFFVNGKKVTETCPEPEATLLQYLRRHLLLPGTKEGCGHGGCGSCTVMVSRMDYRDKQIRHYTVNACLFPLCAAHGLAITTVEGVGSPRTGLHEVQRRLIESHGLQCGFCTPGFVMSVFTLLRNNPKPTRNELEKAIEGNLCRCTGYRPIVQAFNRCVRMLVPKENCVAKTVQSYLHLSRNAQLILRSYRIMTQIPVRLPYSQQNYRFKGRNWTWIRPTTVEELLTLKHEYPDAPVIMGNTIAGLNLKLGKYKGNVLVYGGGISSLKSVDVLEKGISIGSGLTINELEEKLQDAAKQIHETKWCHFSALYFMIEVYGSDQIRNTATVGGSIMSGRSNSDIITVFAGLGVDINIQSRSSRRTEKIDGLKLSDNEVITSVFLPFANKNEHAMFYKHSDRRTFSFALLNSCIYVRLTQTGVIECIRMAFGGIGKQVVVVDENSNLKGKASCLQKKHWNTDFLENVLASLPEILNCEEDQSSNGYKLALAAGFVFKFFERVNQEKNLTNETTITKTSVATEKKASVPCSGTQIYEPFTDSEQKETDFLHKPIPSVSSEAIVSGKAVYVDDIPEVAGELFLALVTSKRAHAKITNIDASAALAVPGVHGFIDHEDIPGQNMWGTFAPEEELLATEEVTFYGQPIGGIIAESRELARHAACLVKIEYQDLEAIMTLEASVSRILGVPCHKVNCAIKRLGGGFGGKQDRPVMIVGPAAVAAQKFNRPIRCILSRETDMEITGKRHPFYAKYKVGVMQNGRIRALDIQMYANSGSSLGVSAVILHKTAADFNGAYKIDNLNFNGVVCRTNVPSNTPFRAYGPPEGFVIMEDIIFNIACSLDLPQETVREINHFRNGDLTKYGMPLVNFTLPELWKMCCQNSNFTQRKQDTAKFNRQNRWKKRGLVIMADRYSIGWPLKQLYQGTAVVSVYRDGTVLLTHGGIEMGQGINTKMIQIASRELDIPIEMIYTSDSNTKTTPNSVLTAASMGTDTYGPAVMDACRIMAERLKTIKEANPNATWKELIEEAYSNRVKLTATGFSRYPKEQYDPVSKTGSKADYYTYGVVCTEVEIDVLSGAHQVLQTDIVMDVGKSLNPAIDIGQIEGAFVQGLGMVTSEYIDVDERGKMTNCNSLSYKIPNVRCVPRKFNITLVQENSAVTPVYSAKAIGEPPLLLSISVLMAIKEAIKEARAEIGLSGYFRLDSPATVERIRLACCDQLTEYRQ